MTKPDDEGRERSRRAGQGTFRAAHATALAVALLAQTARPATDLGEQAWERYTPGAKEALRAAARPGQSRTCFGAQLDDLAWGARAARSTLYLAALDRQNRPLFTGSGFVVADSAGRGEHLNRILTAAHVPVGARTPHGRFTSGRAAASREDAADEAEIERVVALAPNGDFLGEVEVIGRGAQGRDVAVLRMHRFFSPEARRRYAAIPGLELGPGHAGDLVGVFARPAGVDRGMSGGPLLDEQGRVRGVLKEMRDPGWGRREFAAGDVIAMNHEADGRFVARQVSAPIADLGFAEGLPPEIFALLGPAGRRAAALEEAGDDFQAAVLGYRRDACLVLRARVSRPKQAYMWDDASATPPETEEAPAPRGP